MGNTATIAPTSENTPVTNQGEVTALAPIPPAVLSSTPGLPPRPLALPEQQKSNYPFRAELKAESDKSEISMFHLAGLQVAVKERYLSQQNADAIKAKVAAGALRSNGVDLILTAAFRDPEQFKKSFGSAEGNIAAVMRDMDDEISDGLNSHSWSENKYYKPIIQELLSIEKNGFMVPEKPKPTPRVNPNNSTTAQNKKNPDSRTDPKHPGTNPDPKHQKNNPDPNHPENNPDPKPHATQEYPFRSAAIAIRDLGVRMLAIDKATPDPDRLDPDKIRITTQCVQQLHKQSPALSKKDQFYLGVYRIQLEMQGRWKEKTPQERNEIFIKGITKDENSLKKAIETGKKLASSFERDLSEVSSGHPTFRNAQQAIHILEAVKADGSQSTPRPVTATNYEFSLATVAMNDFGRSLIAAEKATPEPDLITSETIKATTQCIQELHRKNPNLSQNDLFYLGFQRMQWELQPSLHGKTAQEKNNAFVEQVGKSQDTLHRAIEAGKKQASRTESDLRKAKPGTALYKDAQKMIAILDAVESSGGR